MISKSENIKKEKESKSHLMNGLINLHRKMIVAAAEEPEEPEELEQEHQHAYEFAPANSQKDIVIEYRCSECRDKIFEYNDDDERLS